MRHGYQIVAKQEILKHHNVEVALIPKLEPRFCWRVVRALFCNVFQRQKNEIIPKMNLSKLTLSCIHFMYMTIVVSVHGDILRWLQQWRDTFVWCSQCHTNAIVIYKVPGPLLFDCCITFSLFMVVPSHHIIFSFILALFFIGILALILNWHHSHCLWWCGTRHYFFLHLILALREIRDGLCSKWLVFVRKNRILCRST